VHSVGDDPASPPHESIHGMLQMAEGEAHAFELSDLADAYKDMYTYLKNAVREEGRKSPDDRWLVRLSGLLDRGRLTREELVDT
jgi:hypothetical protein